MSIVHRAKCFTAARRPARGRQVLKPGTTVRHQSGFTLLELLISTAILVIVSLLTFMVTRSSLSATTVAQAKEVAQAAVRDPMTVMMTELQLASKQSDPALDPALEALAVVNSSEVVFQVPANDTGTQWSAPITYRFVNEDAGEGEAAGNARLDEGEDIDGDGSLTRRIVRIQGGDVRPIGGSNDLSDVQFSLSPTNDVLTITLTATKMLDNRRGDLVSVAASSRVHLLN